MSSDLEAERYALLISQLGSERGFLRGWMSSVAAQLGVHRSYVSRIHAGDRSGIGLSVISRAIERIGLLPSFFSEERDPEPHYKDFLRSSIPALPAPATRVLSDRERDEWWRHLGINAGVLLAVLRGGADGISFARQQIADLAHEVLQAPLILAAEKIVEADEEGVPLDARDAALFLLLLVAEARAHGWVEPSEPADFVRRTARELLTTAGDHDELRRVIEAELRRTS